MDEELKNTDYGKYTPKYLEGREGFMYNEVERVEQSDENYRVTFRYTLFTPGVIVPVKLGFKPEKGMKVIYDSEDHIGASAMLGFYNEKGDCLFMGERTFSSKEGRMKPEWKAILNTQDKQHSNQVPIMPEHEMVHDNEADWMDDDFMTRIDYYLKEANELDKKAAQLRIKYNYEYIKSNEEHICMLRKRVNKSVKDEERQEWYKAENEKIRKDSEEQYKKVNPELATLREEERAKIEKGMDPKQAQKERREAVKAYYNKKSQRGK